MHISYIYVSIKANKKLVGVYLLLYLCASLQIRKKKYYRSVESIFLKLATAKLTMSILEHTDFLFIILKTSYLE